MTDIPDFQQRIVLATRPERGVTVDIFRLETAPVERPRDREVLIRVLALSIDPAMRRWVTAAPGYRKPIALGDVMFGFTVGIVVESRHRAFAVGDRVYGTQGWQEWAISDGSDINHRIDDDITPEAALGVLGHTGLTAYVGLLDVGRPRTGETVLVTTAAGAVGSIVGQIAKLKGARTIGLTGSAAKVEIAKAEFGYDAAFDYKTAVDLSTEIGALAPQGIDVFFDSVCGPLAEAVFPHLNIGARIVQNGTAGLSSDGALTGPRLGRLLLEKRATWQGFLVLDHFDRFPRAFADLSQWIAEGKIRHREEVADGLTSAPQALIDLLAGRNLGKAIVRIARSERQ